MFKKIALALAVITAGVGAASIPAQATPPSSLPAAVSGVDLSVQTQKITPPKNYTAKDFKVMSLPPKAKSSSGVVPNKGLPGRDGRTSTEVTLAAEAKLAKSGDTKALAASRTVCTRPGVSACYYYTGMQQDVVNTGCAAMYSIDWSFVDDSTSDPGGHSLSECAISYPGPGGRHVVEAIVNRDDILYGPNTLGDDDPHLSVFYWVNGQEKGYNTDFIRYTGSGASPYGPGDSLVGLVGTRKQIDMVYINQTGIKGWWVYFDVKPVGYFPADPAATSTAGNRWYPYTFTQGDKAQIFWEVSSHWDKPCTDMGNGRWGNAPFAAPWDYNYDASVISSATLSGGTVNANMNMIPLITVNYGSQFVGTGNRSMLGGGGGWNGDETDWGVTNGC